MAEETPPETFSTPTGAENSSAVQDARFTSASSSTASSLEARCLFPLTTEAQVRANSLVVEEEERNLLLDYSSITNVRPAEEVLCLTEV